MSLSEIDNLYWGTNVFKYVINENQLYREDMELQLAGMGMSEQN